MGLRNSKTRSKTTGVTALNGGHLKLVPAPTNSPNDPIDGSITVVGTTSVSPIKASSQSLTHTAVDAAIASLGSQSHVSDLTPVNLADSVSTPTTSRFVTKTSLGKSIPRPLSTQTSSPRKHVLATKVRDRFDWKGESLS
jgi:hypothetical protein